MILTADEIRDLAIVAGFKVEGSVDDLEAEYAIHNGPLAGVANCDGGDPEYYRHVVTCDGCEAGEVEPIGAAGERPIKLDVFKPFARSTEGWTEDESEQCWYCGYCDNPMKASEDGVRANNESFCSESCATEYHA